MTDIGLRVRHFNTSTGPDTPAGLYLVAHDRTTGLLARIYMDLFGDSPIDEYSDEQVADIVALKIRAARHEVTQALKERRRQTHG